MGTGFVDVEGKRLLRLKEHSRAVEARKTSSTSRLQRDVVRDADRIYFDHKAYFEAGYFFSALNPVKQPSLLFRNCISRHSL